MSRSSTDLPIRLDSVEGRIDYPTSVECAQLCA